MPCPPGQPPVQPVQRRAGQLEGFGHVGAVPARGELVPPGVDDHLTRPVDREGELAAGLARGHRAGGPVDRAPAVPPDMTAEARPGLRPARAVQPPRLEGLGAEFPDAGDVADQIPDLGGRGGEMDGHGAFHQMRIGRGAIAAVARCRPVRGNVPGTVPAYCSLHERGRPGGGSAAMRRAVAARRFRLASPVTALVAGAVVLALMAAEFPLSGLARQGLNQGGGGAPLWFSAPFAVVGFVVAWRKPVNRLGWILLALGGLRDGSRGRQLLRGGLLPAAARHAAARMGGTAGPAHLVGRDRAGRAGRPAFPRWPAAHLRLRWVLWVYPRHGRRMDGQCLRLHGKRDHQARHPRGYQR